ncbi:DUF3410 domain-containing protein [Pantoea sp. Aalb]|uniref:DUF3410 domain-containing protein n=1 Tax=Pantoea sp. Aalb TaxID=2576762 RepID=UPI001328660F|nr:DUF3410 domain-containing protein [Pantoea sp. Aalb]MXP67294.1 DUF3410 domain-containing protein [Pantoea sp. Aalb]
MKIIVDENMPYAYELFSRTGKVLSVPGRELSKIELKDTIGLMVRSITNVNAKLLDNTSIKFVGTATSGTEHIDYHVLKKKGISFSSAPGCNSIAVVEYIFSVLFFLAERDGFDLRNRIVGIIGAGNIGNCLNKRLKVLGVETLICDPPRKNRGDKEIFYSLDELVAKADILTFHTPLFIDGLYKSWHLVDINLLNSLKKNTILINTCRGSVVDNKALLQILTMRKDISVILDVWEEEPNISLELLNKIDIATPHIAGYTLEGKTRGTIQIFESWCNFIDKPQQIILENLLPKPEFSTITLHGNIDQYKLKRLIHLIYDVRRDDTLLRKLTAIDHIDFDLLRAQYQERREWSSLQVICDNTETVTILNKLGFNATLQ